MLKSEELTETVQQLNSQSEPVPLRAFEIEKQMQFASLTICKIISPDPEMINSILACLQTTFEVKKTSGKIYSDDSHQFFQFFKLRKKV